MVVECMWIIRKRVCYKSWYYQTILVCTIAFVQNCGMYVHSIYNGSNVAEGRNDTILAVECIPFRRIFADAYYIIFITSIPFNLVKVKSS